MSGRLFSDFGPRERELCKFIQPRLARATATLARHERATRVADALRAFFGRNDAAYFLATADARILEISEPARRWLSAAVPGGLTEPGRLPAACAELRSALARRPGERNARIFVTVPAGTLQAFVLHLPAGGISAVILQQNIPTSATAPKLTRREAEILGWLGEGKTNVEIAALLGISPRTVEKHCENLFAKLGVENRFGAALLHRHRAP